MPKSSKIFLLAISVALVVMFFVGVNSSGVSAASADQDGAYRQINVYSEVLQHIQSDYVTDPNINSVTNGALRGLFRGDTGKVPKSKRDISFDGQVWKKPIVLKKQSHAARPAG